MNGRRERDEEAFHGDLNASGALGAADVSGGRRADGVYRRRQGSQYNVYNLKGIETPVDTSACEKGCFGGTFAVRRALQPSTMSISRSQVSLHDCRIRDSLPALPLAQPAFPVHWCTATPTARRSLYRTSLVSYPPLPQSLDPRLLP